RFSLPAGHTSAAVVHQTMDELWYVLAGRGEMWRSHDGQETTICLLPGLSLSLPAGTHFQFRAAPDTELAILGVSMPPWPGDHEALAVAGPWPPSAAPYP
ncbi:MAG: cupin domain-containing protein, partial [Rhodocyclaceae bacterium]|nr:cupin domain-containing protein [Rhodocyclaceae bacterium]